MQKRIRQAFLFHIIGLSLLAFSSTSFARVDLSDAIEETAQQQASLQKQYRAKRSTAGIATPQVLHKDKKKSPQFFVVDGTSETVAAPETKFKENNSRKR